MHKSVPRYISNAHSLLVLPLSKQFYVFTKDLTQLIADLKAADDRLAVVRRYEDALVAKVEVRCVF